MRKIVQFIVILIAVGGIVSYSHAGLPQHMRKVATKADAEKITSGKVAMACSKCQSIQVAEVEGKNPAPVGSKLIRNTGVRAAEARSR